MNRPSRTDYYLMRLMSLQLSDPPDNLTDLKVNLTYDDERKPFKWTKEGEEVATAQSKSNWLPGLNSGKIRVINLRDE